MSHRNPSHPPLTAGHLVLFVMLAGLGMLSLAGATPPQRVVSINLCTDQLLLMLADPEQITSISHLARDPESSFLAGPAAAYPSNHARLEELLSLRPDLLLAGRYNDPRLLRQLTGFGLRVEQFPLTHDIAGIKADIRRMARLLGHPQRGASLIDAMQSKIADSARQTAAGGAPKALFYQPRGYTSGQQTLQDEALRAAGWRNVAAELGIVGYAPIDLESLLRAAPERIFTSSYTAGARSRAQQQLRHPALRRLLRGRAMREIPYRYWICAGPMIGDAIQLLRAAHGD